MFHGYSPLITLNVKSPSPCPLPQGERENSSSLWRFDFAHRPEPVEGGEDQGEGAVVFIFTLSLFFLLGKRFNPSPSGICG